MIIDYFANASLMRNLVLHYSFHLKTPPWKLWQHENLFEVLVDEGSARVVVNLFPKWVVGSAHVIEPITQILFAQWELTAEKFLEGVTLFCVPNLNISLWINAVPLILLGRGSFGSYKMNIIDKNSVPILGTGPREKDNCKSEYVGRKIWGRKWTPELRLAEGYLIDILNNHWFMAGLCKTLDVVLLWI